MRPTSPQTEEIKKHTSRQKCVHVRRTSPRHRKVQSPHLSVDTRFVQSWERPKPFQERGLTVGLEGYLIIQLRRTQICKQPPELQALLSAQNCYVPPSSTAPARLTKSLMWHEPTSTRHMFEFFPGFTGVVSVPTPGALCRTVDPDPLKVADGTLYRKEGQPEVRLWRVLRVYCVRSATLHS